MITWLASYPRSGNSFARIGLFCLFGIRSRTIYPADDDARTIDKIIGKPVPEMTAAEMAASPESFFAKTHELPGGEPLPAIYFVRDGRDALVSYAHYILHEEHGASPASNHELFLQTLQDLIIGKERFGGWASHIRAWTQRNTPTSLIRFEDLIADPGKELRRALVTVGEIPPVQTGASVPVFENMHEVVPWFFRRGRVGAWRTEMPLYLQELFWRLHGDLMHELGYEKDGQNSVSSSSVAQKGIDSEGHDGDLASLSPESAPHTQPTERRPATEVPDLDRAITAIVQQVRRGDALEATIAAQLAAIRERDRVVADLEVAAVERLAGLKDKDIVIGELNTAASERLSALILVDSALREARSEISTLRAELKELRCRLKSHA